MHFDFGVLLKSIGVIFLILLVYYFYELGRLTSELKSCRQSCKSYESHEYRKRYVIGIDTVQKSVFNETTTLLKNMVDDLKKTDCNQADLDRVKTKYLLDRTKQDYFFAITIQKDCKISAKFTYDPLLPDLQGKTLTIGFVQEDGFYNCEFNSDWTSYIANYCKRDKYL